MAAGLACLLRRVAAAPRWPSPAPTTAASIADATLAAGKLTFDFTNEAEDVNELYVLQGQR